MQRILSAMMVVFLSLVSVVSAQAEKSAWQGLHLSYGATTQSGNHDFTLSHERWGSYEVWAFPVSGSGSALEVGYRWQVGETRLILGPTISVIQGGLSGVRSWEHAKTGASAQLMYQSEFQATAGLELGYIVNERLLVTAEAGFAASDASLTLSGLYRGYTAESAIEGYVPGEYVSLGINYRFESGATLGLEVGHYLFECEDQWGSVNGELSTEATVVSLELGFQF